MDWTEDIEVVNQRGLRLVATVHRPERPDGRAVVVCHGMLSSRSSPKHQGICRALARRGVTAARLDFAGRGDSEGSTEGITYEGQIDDLESLLSVIGDRLSPIGFVGSSMGGAVVLLTAARRRDVGCVVGIAAVGRPRQVLIRLVGGEQELERCRRRGGLEVEGHRFGPELLQSVEQVDVVGAAASLDCPVLLLHGDRDEVVDPGQARELAAVAKQAELVTIAGGDHRLHGASDQALIERRVSDFVDKALAPRGGAEREH